MLLNNENFAKGRSVFEPIILVQRVVLGMAILTFCLMALGSATRVMNAGLACPDWPLCYGELVPRNQMNLQVFLEWFHRTVASTLGLVTIGLVGYSWWQRSRLPRWLPYATLACLTLVLVQGLLGGLTVTQLLRFDVVTAHLATGLLFFCTLLIIACCLIPYQGTGVVGQLAWLGPTAAGLVYLQSILGGLVASQWALHQCVSYANLCQVMNNHLLGVVPATLAVLLVVGLATKRAALHPLLRRLSLTAGLFLVLQIVLGVATFRLQLQVPALTVAHQAIGAALLGSIVAFSAIAIRDRRQSCQCILTTPPLPSAVASQSTVASS